MKEYFIHVFIGLLIMVFISFALGIEDTVYIEQYHTGIFTEDIFNSLKYYVQWVLPFWWLIILLGSFFIGGLITIVKNGSRRFSN